MLSLLACVMVLDIQGWYIKQPSLHSNIRLYSDYWQVVVSSAPLSPRTWATPRPSCTTCVLRRCPPTCTITSASFLAAYEPTTQVRGSRFIASRDVGTATRQSSRDDSYPGLSKVSDINVRHNDLVSLRLSPAAAGHQRKMNIFTARKQLLLVVLAFICHQSHSGSVFSTNE